MHFLLTLALVAPQSPVVKHISEGPQVGAPAGLALAATPDWNGDGIDDYVVGIPDFDTTSAFGSPVEEAGQVQIRSGADGSLLASVTESVFSPTDPRRLGQSVAGGFIDGVSNPASFPMAGVPGAGQVRSITINAFGGIVTGATVATADSSSLFNDESFGAVIANIGDITGDGWPELAVGSPEGDRLFPNPLGGNPLTVADVGRVRVFEGGTYNELGRWSTFAASGARFGSSIMAIADVNGDGVNEMAVGAPGDGAGRVYIIDPTVSESAGILAEITGTNDGDEFGASLANLGDLDSGGRDELLVGAPGRSVGLTVGFPTGRVEAIDGESYALMWAKNGSAFGYVGETVAAADLNGDGFKSALIVDGATLLEQPARVRAYDGSSGVEETSFDAWPADSRAALASGFDVDNDGGEDFLVGLPQLDYDKGGQLCYGLYLGPGGGPGATNRWLVDDDNPADFSSLAVACLAVSPGDLIEVAAGNYAPTTITKQLTIMGLGVPFFSPSSVESITVTEAARLTLTNLTLEALSVSNISGRASLGELNITGEATTTITNCADIALVDCELRTVADPESGAAGPDGLRVSGSSLQLVASRVIGADGPIYSNDGGDAVVLTNGSKLWSMGSSLIAGDGDFGLPKFFFPGGNGGDALLVGDGCEADVRGRTDNDKLIAGDAGIDSFDVIPEDGVEIRAVGSGHARVSNTMSDGISITLGAVTFLNYSAPWLDYQPVAKSGSFWEMRAYSETLEATFLLPSLGPANISTPTILGTPLWIDVLTLGQPVPIGFTTLSNPETGFSQSYAVPADQSFIGFEFHVQALIFDPETGTYEGTNGGAVTLGN